MDGFEGHMGTNYLGPFLLTMLLLPCLQRTAAKVRLVEHMLFPAIVCVSEHSYLRNSSLWYVYRPSRLLLRLLHSARHRAALTPAFSMQSNHGRPIRIVNVSSKMHELSPGIDVRDPHFAMGRAYSSLAAYNRSKLAQVAFPGPFAASFSSGCE